MNSQTCAASVAMYAQTDFNQEMFDEYHDLQTAPIQVRRLAEQ